MFDELGAGFRFIPNGAHGAPCPRCEDGRPMIYNRRRRRWECQGCTYRDAL